jgi:anti-anti-sigma factor
MLDRIEISSWVADNGVRVVKPEGVLDAFSFVELKDFLSALCAQYGGIRVIVDLSEVPFVASSGWSVLLSRRLALRRLGGELSIFGLGIGPKRVYESMRIHEMLPAADNAAEATKLLHLGEFA